MTKFIFGFIAIAGLLLSNSYAGVDKSQTNKGKQTMELKIESSAFKEGGMIPSRFTCDGEDISPELRWSNVPAGTKSFALIADDPDAPSGTWVHWVLFNVPAKMTGLAEKFPASKTFPDSSVSGVNDFGKFGYGGPCPPSGTHRYFFKLYALDILLDLRPGASKKQVLDGMKGHVLSQGQLIGKYGR